MLLGQPDHFAIEIGAADSHPEFQDVYIQFRFWIGSVPMGDWHEQISLSASINAAAHFCDLAPQRRSTPFAQASPAHLFQQAYEAYFSLACFVGKSGTPDLRTLHHLDPIGMGAIRDKFGLILVASPDGQERILAKDLNQNLFAADLHLPLGCVESTLAQYIAWGKSKLPAPNA